MRVLLGLVRRRRSGAGGPGAHGPFRVSAQQNAEEEVSRGSGRDGAKGRGREAGSGARFRGPRRKRTGGARRRVRPCRGVCRCRWPLLDRVLVLGDLLSMQVSVHEELHHRPGVRLAIREEVDEDGGLRGQGREPRGEEKGGRDGASPHGASSMPPAPPGFRARRAGLSILGVEVRGTTAAARASERNAGMAPFADSRAIPGQARRRRHPRVWGHGFGVRAVFCGMVVPWSAPSGSTSRALFGMSPPGGTKAR